MDFDLTAINASRPGSDATTHPSYSTNQCVPEHSYVVAVAQRASRNFPMPFRHAISIMSSGATGSVHICFRRHPLDMNLTLLAKNAGYVGIEPIEALFVRLRSCHAGLVVKLSPAK